MIRQTTRLWVTVGFAATIGAALWPALLLAPVPQPFAMHGTAIYDPNSACIGFPPSLDCSELDTTQGTVLDFHWSASSSTAFFVVSLKTNQVAYAGSGTSGSGALTSVGGFYQFGAACPEGPCIPADVSGTYTGPIIPS
jgi:hypothetical protein